MVERSRVLLGLEWLASNLTEESLWLLLLTFRLVNSVCVVSYFNPDEFWQGIEVAHRLVFGYGFLSWEWWPQWRVRSFLYPLLCYCPLFKVLSLIRYDSRDAVILAPKLWHGICAGLSDIFAVKCALKWFAHHLDPLHPAREYRHSRGVLSRYKRPKIDPIRFHREIAREKQAYSNLRRRQSVVTQRRHFRQQTHSSVADGSGASASSSPSSSSAKSNQSSSDVAGESITGIAETAILLNHDTMMNRLLKPENYQRRRKDEKHPKYHRPHPQSRLSSLAVLCTLCLWGNWFLGYCSVRMFVNSVEQTLTMIALYFYPISSQRMYFHSYQRRRLLSILISGVCIAIRPTSLVFWLVLYVNELRQLYKYGRMLLIKKYLEHLVGLGLLLLLVLVGIDTGMYTMLRNVHPSFNVEIHQSLNSNNLSDHNQQHYSVLSQKKQPSWIDPTMNHNNYAMMTSDFSSKFLNGIVFTPLNFIHFNLMLNGSSLYGVHPWYWYFVVGIPAVVGLFLPYAIYGVYRAYFSPDYTHYHHSSSDLSINKDGNSKTKKRKDSIEVSEAQIQTLLPFTASMVSVLVMGVSAHKEFRFLLPLVPVWLCYAALGWYHLLSQNDNDDGCDQKVNNSISSSKKKKTKNDINNNDMFNNNPESNSKSCSENALVCSAIACALINLGVWVFLGMFHQSAPIDVLDFIADDIERDLRRYSDLRLSDVTIDLMLPCHSTPFYAYMHLRRDSMPMMRMLDCSPIYHAGIRQGTHHHPNQKSSEGDRSVNQRAWVTRDGTEDDRFKKDPLQFLRSFYGRISKKEECPTYIVIEADKVSHLKRVATRKCPLVLVFAATNNYFDDNDNYLVFKVDSSPHLSLHHSSSHRGSHYTHYQSGGSAASSANGNAGHHHSGSAQCPSNSCTHQS